MRVCPVCGEEMGKGTICENCNFDESQDYEKYSTLSEIPKGTPSRKSWRKQFNPIDREKAQKPPKQEQYKESGNNGETKQGKESDSQNQGKESDSRNQGKESDSQKQEKEPDSQNQGKESDLQNQGKESDLQKNRPKYISETYRSTESTEKDSKSKMLLYLTAGFSMAAVLCLVIVIAYISSGDTLRYVNGVTVSVWNGLQGYQPEHMAVKGSTLYFTQDGRLYSLRDETVSGPISLYVEGSDIDYQADTIHVWNNHAVYVLTKPFAVRDTVQKNLWQFYCTILRVNPDDSVTDMLSDAVLLDEWMPENETAVPDADSIISTYLSLSVTDFAVSDEGEILWYLERDTLGGLADYTLYSISYKRSRDVFDCSDRKAIQFQFRVSAGTSPRMVFDADENLYLSAPEDGWISCLKKNAQRTYIFAGKSEDVNDEVIQGIRELNDYEGLFLSPTVVACDDAYLYVLDSGLVRRIRLDDGSKVETLAGQPVDSGQATSYSPSQNETVAGKDALFAVDPDSDMVVTRDGVLLTVSSENMVYQIGKG